MSGATRSQMGQDRWLDAVVRKAYSQLVSEPVIERLQERFALRLTRGRGCRSEVDRRLCRKRSDSARTFSWARWTCSFSARFSPDRHSWIYRFGQAKIGCGMCGTSSLWSIYCTLREGDCALHDYAPTPSAHQHLWHRSIWMIRSWPSEANRLPL